LGSQQTQIMKTIIFIFLLLIPYCSFSQSIYSLSGFLKYKNGVPAKDVTVSVLRSNDSLSLQRSYTTNDGKYTFRGLERNRCFLVFTSLGTEKLTYGPIAVGDHDVLLDTLTVIQTTAQLKEVTIKGATPLIQKTIDKTIINVENTSLSVGNNALDILDRAPGVIVSNGGNIQLNGKSGVTVMLDGKLTYLSAAQLGNLLRSTASSQIKSIEIMTHPPVKYEASGSAGMINIILKKKNDAGTNVNITADAALGKYLKANTGISINSHVGAFNLYGNYNYAKNKRYGLFDVDRAVNVPGNSSTISQTSNSTAMNFNHNYKAGIDYNVNKNNTVGFFMNGYINDQSEVVNSYSSIINKSAGPSEITALNTAKNRYVNRSYDLNYKSVLDSLGQELTLDLGLLNYNNAEENLYENHFSGREDDQDLLPVVFRNTSPTALRITAVKADYTLPVTKTSKMEFGFKISTVKTNNDFLVEDYKNDSWVKNLLQSNNFLYQETIHAAYANLAKSWIDFSFQVGVRAEQTLTEGRSVTLSDLTKRNYIDLFPVLSFSEKINADHTIGLILNRRIDRPNYGSLNPFLYYLDLYTYKTGNVNLKPQYTNSMALNYQLHQKYILGLEYSNTKNVITTVIKPDTLRNALFTTPENLAQQQTLGISLSIPLSVGKFWNMYHDLSVYHTGFNSDQVAGLRYSSNQTAFNFKSYHSFSLSKSAQFDFSFNYQSKQLYGTSYLKSISFIDLGTSYKLLKERLSAKFAIKDVFNQKGQTMYSNLPGINYTLYDKPETRLISLGLNYSFGSKDLGSVRRRSEGIAEEKGRIGGIR
jgi:hypothetical protein